MIEIIPSGGSTWFVERDEQRLGTVNFPGNDPRLPFHAISEDETMNLCFASKDEAIEFLVSCPKGMKFSHARNLAGKTIHCYIES